MSITVTTKYQTLYVLAVAQAVDTTNVGVLCHAVRWTCCIVSRLQVYHHPMDHV